MCSGGSAAPRRRRRPPRPSRSAAAVPHDGEHVLLAHPPAAAGALHVVEVDAVLGRDPLHDGGVAAAADAGAAGRARGAGRLGGRRGRGRRGGVARRRRCLARGGGGGGAARHRPRSRAPRPAWRRWRSAPAPSRRRPSRRPPRGSRPGDRPPARAPRCRSCRSRCRRRSPRRPTQSPGCLRHSTSVPSRTETPICGIVRSTRVSVLEELTRGLLDLVDGGQDGLLERRRERDRHVGRRDPAHRPVEVLEARDRR